MAGKKVGAIKIKLVNPETGCFYVTKKNPKKLIGALRRRAYDKVSRKHEIFKEEKI